MTVELNVSCETLRRFEIYASLLKKWNRRINLVSHATVDDFWARHIADSIQLYDHALRPISHWVDLGSGGGFPGLPIAILATERHSSLAVTLVESDARKCAFLRSVIRETGVIASVKNARIEEVSPLSADIVSARALADLGTLLGYTKRHLLPSGLALFPKGRTWRQEISDAERSWQFTYQVAKSRLDQDAVVLSIPGDFRDR